jgi:anti-sigma B factor antagonist
VCGRRQDGLVPEVRVEVRRSDPATGVVVPRGDLDLSGAPRLREALTEALVAGCTRIVIDLRAVSFIDSTGLGVIVGIAKKAPGGLRSVTLVCADPRMLRLLAVTGIDRVLTVTATPDEALTGPGCPA